MYLAGNDTHIPGTYSSARERAYVTKVVASLYVLHGHANVRTWVNSLEGPPGDKSSNNRENIGQSWAPTTWRIREKKSLVNWYNRLNMLNEISSYILLQVYRNTLHLTRIYCPCVCVNEATFLWFPVNDETSTPYSSVINRRQHVFTFYTYLLFSLLIYLTLGNTSAEFHCTTNVINEYVWFVEIMGISKG